MIQIILFLTTILAYFVKGMSGFGPALFVVPVFTLLAGAPVALTASALMDAVAGLVLIGSVWKKIDWRFSLPIILAISLGSFSGAQLIFFLPQTVLRRAIGGMLLIFVLYMLFHSEPTEGSDRRPALWLTLLAAFGSGLSGGLVGMSGPPLVAFMKFYFRKSFFRSQLIVIFLMEKFVRLAVYHNRNLLPQAQWPSLMIYIPFLLAGLWLGSRIHARISERQFNRAVGAVLLIPAAKLLLF